MREEPISSEVGLEALRVELTHALLEAGFAIHHAHLPSGGVRLIVDVGGPDGDGILVSWAAAVTLDSDARRRDAYEVVLATMNRALAQVLTALDYAVVPQGDYGVALVTGRARRSGP
jgi:hypothetical protein